ncbi:MAG: hypothetical protein A2496_08800 [Burkholderiales bacterium RIFOXYC12_FULL_60_6]|nr:MAG: hypothetical protein A2496_08800 [Burkholderiales bacterium RIFOXYC12_FULL_60_6]
MKTVLYLSSSGAQYWTKTGNTWQAQDSVGAGPVYLLCNLPEEGFEDIKVPRIFGADRQSFIRRQLASRFPDTPYTALMPTPVTGGLMDHLAPPRQIAFGLEAAQRVNTTLVAVGPIPIAGVWATSLLLAQLASHKSLSRDLFVVFPDVDALRIVFVKQRVPILTRLIPSVTQAPDIAAEITRTVRYLENNRVLERSSEPRHVLMLGNPPEIEPCLKQENLKWLAPPPPWHKKRPADWRFVLFDMATASPTGQLAPLVWRSRFVADRMRAPVYAAAGLCLLLALLVAADNLNQIAADYSNEQAIAQRNRLHELQISEIEQKIAGFGVSADEVRNAVILEQTELAHVPSLSSHLQLLSETISSFGSFRLVDLDWHILNKGQEVCGGAAAETAPSANEAQAEPVQTLPTRQVEISFQIVDLLERGERAKMQAITSFSAKLTQVQGLNLQVDPAKVLDLGSLSGGGALIGRPGDKPLVWCLTMPWPASNPKPGPT